MKKLLFIVAAMFAAVSFSSCDKDDDNGGGSDFARPALPDPNDVCSCMDDLVFMQYCYENFDVNKDGKVSKTEANAVTKIDLGYTYNYQDAYDVKTLTGICYFPNLEIINCSNCKRLTSVDLSHNLKITVIQSETFYYCSDLKSIILPNSVTRIGKSAFYGCSSLTNITIPNSVTT
ncbi:leucine-rich repeat domain-containing protein, partial [uncultured Alistipes sp.]|uniref:leucine-rich repeat domain-containing protein n=1 Tax=uncultured Alistipes sp. TaxID=538949 RepID=UPI0026331EB1